MIDAAAKQMADQFFGAFQAHVAPAAAPVPDATADTRPQTPLPADTVAQPSAAPAPIRAADSASAPPAALPASTEWLRVKWFALGALATALGVWVGARL
jgi:hypothetical protein